METNENTVSGASNLPTPPAKQKTEVGKILAGIDSVVSAPFSWGAKEFGIITKSFQAEDPAIQSGLASVSGMLQIIKLNLAETPAVIIYLVKKAYPQFNEAKILQLLQSGVTDLSLAEKIVGEDLPSFLTSLAQHVLGTSDTGWNLFWDGLFKAVSMVAVPGTIWGKIVTYAAYVYNVLVKPTVK